MALDPSISLNIRPAQIESPLEQYGKVLSLRNAITQGQLQQQQLQIAPLQRQAMEQENQLRQQGMTDDAAARQMFAKAQTQGTRPSDSEILSKLGYTHGPGLIKSLREADKSDAEIKEIRGKAAALESDYAGGLAAMVRDANYTPDAVSLAIQHAHTAGYEAQAQQLQAVLQNSPDQIKPLMDALIAKSPKQQELASQKTTADARAKQADTVAAKFALESPGIEAEGRIKQGEANAINMPPEIAQKQVGAVIDPAKYPDEYKQTLAAYQQALTLKEKNEVLNKALEGMRVTQRETNPAVIQARVNQAVATERATSPLKVDQAIQTELGKARLAPEVVSGIHVPALQAKAIDDYTRAKNEYEGKAGDAQRLQSFVEAARSGNQAAAGLIPVAELREIVNRVNRQELQAAGGGVSAARRVENWLTSGATGKPTDATLNDIEQLGKAMLGSNKRTFAGKVNAINVLGGKFPTEPASSTLTLAPATIRYTSGGTTYNIPADQESAFLKDHPGAKK